MLKRKNKGSSSRHYVIILIISKPSTYVNKDIQEGIQTLHVAKTKIGIQRKYYSSTNTIVLVDHLSMTHGTHLNKVYPLLSFTILFIDFPILLTNFNGNKISRL